MSQQDGGPDDGFTLVTSSTRRRRVNIETKHVKPNSHAGGRGNIGKGNGKARTNSAQQALVQDGQAASVDVAPTEADIDKMRKSVLAHRHILRQGKLGEMIRGEPAISVAFDVGREQHIDGVLTQQIFVDSRTR